MMRNGMTMKCTTQLMLLVAVAVLLGVASTGAFQQSTLPLSLAATTRTATTTSSSSCNRQHATTLFMEAQYQQQQDNQNLLAVRAFLQENYPIFFSILEKNDEVWKAIAEDDVDKGEYGFTIFAPSDGALNQIGDKKASQLMDPRNLETTQKIAGYHIIGETVTAEQLYNCGGVMTVSGEIPVERSTSGGVFGMGGQEDGGVLINKAKATQTWNVGTGLVHEVDALVCPNIMWRYMDQLRIPGSS